MTAMSIFGFDKVSTDCLACPDGMPLGGYMGGGLISSKNVLCNTI